MQYLTIFLFYIRVDGINLCDILPQITTNNHFDINGIIFKDNNDKIIISCLKNGLLKIQFNYGNEKSEEIIDEIINLYNIRW